MEQRLIRYVRKLSGGEAKDGYVMIMNDSLKLFPKAGEKFEIKFGDLVHTTDIKIVDCWCQGPKKPHVHYRVDLTPFFVKARFHYGQVVTLKQINDNSYELFLD